MAQNNDRTTEYSDYVCSFCYLGRRSLEEYQDKRDSDLQINWKSFDLQSQKRGSDGEIDHSADDGKDEAYFDQAARMSRD